MNRLQADLNQTATLQTNQTLNLDTGATGNDRWRPSLERNHHRPPRGAAKGYKFPASLGNISTFTKATVDPFKSFAGPGTFNLNVDDGLLVFTNGNNSAAVRSQNTRRPAAGRALV